MATCTKCGQPTERFGEPLGDWRDWCDDCRDVEVQITFDISKMSAEQREAFYRARHELGKVGISFDTGTNGACFDWEWDWSLKGPVRVLFKQFTKNNPKNRYVRAAQGELQNVQEEGKRAIEEAAEHLSLKVN